MFRFFQKPSLEYILTKGVQTIYKLNQSKTTNRIYAINV